MTSLDNEPPQQPTAPLDPGIFQVTISKKDQELDRLTSRIEHLEDRRKEERFGWIVAILAVVNYLLLKDVANLITPLIVFILELMALLVLARRSGVEYIEIVISKLIGSVTKRFE